MGTQPLPQKGGGAPTFPAISVVAQMAAWIKMPLGMEVGLGPGDIVLDGAQSPSRKRGQSAHPQFPAHVYLWPRLPISGTAELLFYSLSNAANSLGR